MGTEVARSWRTDPAIIGKALLIAGCVVEPASAYVGPGAGLALIGSVVAVGAAVLIAVVALVLFPLRMAIKAARRRSAGVDDRPIATAAADLEH
jgi:hypothetical protein